MLTVVLWVGPFWRPAGVLKLPGLVSEALDQPDSVGSLSQGECVSLLLGGCLEPQGWGQHWTFHFLSPAGPFLAFWSKAAFKDILE